MDITQILQFSIYSKITQEFANDKRWLENPIIILLFAFYFLYQILPYPWIVSIKISLSQFLQINRNESSIFLPYHIKTYGTYSGKSIQKIHYSERFLAINHYLRSKKEITQLVEVMNFENSKDIYHQESEFILIPNNYEKICICHKGNIWFEVLSEQSEDNSQKEEKTSSSSSIAKKYIYRLSIPKSHSIEVLHQFVEKCIKEYKKANDTEEQRIYEYMKYNIDEDSDRICMTFRSCPFFSNKTFENLFLSVKDEIRQEIADFLVHSTDEEKGVIVKKYRDLGIPYKKIFLLYGPPGCGKTSLIKAISIETGRHIIHIPWSRMKTCAEFSDLFYEIKIEGKVLQQKDVIFVFEDFDANQNDAIKSRNIENLANKPNTQTQSLYDKTDIEKKKREVEDPVLKIALENLLTPIKMGSTDELTLECVLNVLDGIKELYNAVIIFTTNNISAIDPAVIRPGRVDRIIELKLADRSVIKGILGHFYRDIDPDRISVDQAVRLLPSGIAISPAKVQEICLEYKGNIVGAIDEINRVFLGTVSPCKTCKKML